MENSQLKTCLTPKDQEIDNLKKEIHELKTHQESLEQEINELKSRLELLEQENLQPRNEPTLSSLMDLITPDDPMSNELQFDLGVEENRSEEQDLDYDPVLDKSNHFTFGVATWDPETPKEVLKKVNNNKPMLVKENECKKKPIILWSENGVDLKLDTWSVIDSIRKEMKSMECTPKKGILSKENFLLPMISKNWRTFYHLHKNLMSQWMIHCFFHTIKKNERIFMMELRNRILPFKKRNISGKCVLLDILFCQITKFIKFHVAFAFGLQTL